MYDYKIGEAFPLPLKWRDVRGFEGVYQVSNYGSIRSVDRWVTFERKGVEITRLFDGRLLKPKKDKDGYHSCTLINLENKKFVRVHRIVAETFKPNIDSGSLVVDHIDADIDNNCIWNLQWLSSTQNTIKHYAKDAGLDNSLSSLSRQDWLYIGFLYNAGICYQAICDNLGLGIKSPDTIWTGLSADRLSSVTGFVKGQFTKRVHPTTKIDIYTVALIIKERKIDKVPLKCLASKYNIAESMTSRFCSGNRQPKGLMLFNEAYSVRGYND